MLNKTRKEEGKEEVDEASVEAGPTRSIG